jgi:flagellar hook-associated protein 2
MPSFSIDGITSGINTAEFIDALIEFERRPAALMEVDQAEKTNTISTLKALQAKILALKTKAVQLTRQRNFEVGRVTVSDETAISASALGRVTPGSYNLRVLSLARNHQIASQGISSDSLASFGTGTITIAVGSASPKTITIDSTNNSLVGIKQAINEADAGVTATIINDGSRANAYRLVVAADDSGVANSIEITSNLAGGQNLNFNTAGFDTPERVVMDAASTSQISLGSSAAFTGNENKIYTFTVSSIGTQTVGEGAITIDWTDGIDSGSIIVTQADQEIDLNKDGLYLNFSAGQLKQGDTFQVQTFSPLLQQASDARVAVGSTGGTGSPITVTSPTNKLDNIIPGVSLELLKETQPGDFVTINTDLDVAAIKAKINEFISAYNDVNDFIDEQNSYNADTDKAGTLLGDYAVQSMQYTVRRAVASRVKGIESKYSQLYSVGIRTDLDGKLTIKDNARLEEALREDLDEVIGLFTDSGNSSSSGVEFITAGTNTRLGETYSVNITRAATPGSLNGTGIQNPAANSIALNDTNNRLKLSVNGIQSEELILTQRTYSSADELVREIQDKIDSDSRIGTRGLTVEWVAAGDGTGYLRFTSSTYGSGSKVERVLSVSNNAYSVLGLSTATAVAGQDVAGTINGEEAEGNGQYLTGKEGNETTDGLNLRVTLTDEDLTASDEAAITLSRGVASHLNNVLDRLTAVGEGLLDRRIKTYESQVQDLVDRIAEFDERLALRRESLVEKFQKMEEVLSQMSAQSTFLAGQLANISSNWRVSNGSYFS